MNLMRLPQLGSGMLDADIVEWLVQPGAEVAVGDPLVVIESTKVAETLESPYAGTVLRIFPEVGDVLPISLPLVAIGTPDEMSAAAEIDPTTVS